MLKQCILHVALSLVSDIHNHLVKTMNLFISPPPILPHPPPHWRVCTHEYTVLTVCLIKHMWHSDVVTNINLHKREYLPHSTYDPPIMKPHIEQAEN